MIIGLNVTQRMCRIIDEVLYIVHRIRQEVEGWNGRECKGTKDEERRLGWVDVL
jgi:hypothetical protein